MLNAIKSDELPPRASSLDPKSIAQEWKKLGISPEPDEIEAFAETEDCADSFILRRMLDRGEITQGEHDALRHKLAMRHSVIWGMIL